MQQEGFLIVISNQFFPVLFTMRADRYALSAEGIAHARDIHVLKGIVVAFVQVNGIVSVWVVKVGIDVFDRTYGAGFGAQGTFPTTIFNRAVK